MKKYAQIAAEVVKFLDDDRFAFSNRLIGALRELDGIKDPQAMMASQLKVGVEFVRWLEGIHDQLSVAAIEGAPEEVDNTPIPAVNMSKKDFLDRFQESLIAQEQKNAEHWHQYNLVDAKNSLEILRHENEVREWYDRFDERLTARLAEAYSFSEQLTSEVYGCLHDSPISDITFDDIQEWLINKAARVRAGQWDPANGVVVARLASHDFMSAYGRLEPWFEKISKGARLDFMSACGLGDSSLSADLETKIGFPRLNLLELPTQPVQVDEDSPFIFKET